MKQYFLAKIVSMAQTEILSMVSQSELERIRKKDSQPEIRVYSIGHEGEAELGIVGENSHLLRMLKGAVRMLYRALKVGTAVFHGHAETNKHGGREKIGEVVGGKLKEIKGRLNTLAAIYLYPGQAAKQGTLDVASIEADVVFSGHGSHVHIERIPRVTGIALASSKEEMPGFPGATLLGAVRAFRESQLHQMAGGQAMLTLEDIKEAIRESDLTPSNVFSKAALLGDDAVVKHVRKEVQTEYEHAKRVEVSLGEERKKNRETAKEFEDRIKTLAAEKDILQKDNRMRKVSELAAPILETKKLDETQRKFVERNLPQFSSDADNQDTFRQDLEKFVDRQLEGYSATRKLFGLEEEESPESEGELGLPAGDKSKGEGEEEVDKYEDPTKNPFIPA